MKNLNFNSLEAKARKNTIKAKVKGLKRKTSEKELLEKIRSKRHLPAIDLR